LSHHLITYYNPKKADSKVATELTMSEKDPTLTAATDDRADHDNNAATTNPKHNKNGGGVRAFLKKFSFGDTSLEGHDDGLDGDEQIEGQSGEGNHHHQRTPSGSKGPKLRHALSFGLRKEAGLHGGAGVRWYHNLFPLNQKFEPRVEYPLWDEDW
jgi:hypothetical protein